ncbi:hypothetical protein Taro_015254 [Colocasia esculenta]|uniref:Deoxyuridine 5'-triphosphate nucleotidohydrolase n=1 Tax=Colocasia esculenta TaxID=4460 RepID=A0A843ULK4_COLES|nr:hypothetical protein [Colocasia esculenta]
MAGNFGATRAFAGFRLPTLNTASARPFPRHPAAAIFAISPALILPFGSSDRSREKKANAKKMAANGSAQKVLLAHHQPTAADAPLLRVKRLSENAVLPSRGSLLSAGYDLSSAIETTVPARAKALVPTDLSISIPPGTYARIAPRSGLAWKHSIDVGAGVIDADYRGPVGVVLFNHSDVDFEVRPGDRIAQLIIERIMTPEVAEVEDLDATARGAGGFGSTGV